MHNDETMGVGSLIRIHSIATMFVAYLWQHSILVGAYVSLADNALDRCVEDVSEIGSKVTVH